METTDVAQNLVKLWQCTLHWRILRLVKIYQNDAPCENHAQFLCMA